MSYELSVFNHPARRMERLFDHWLSDWNAAERSFSPACDIEETDKEYRLLVDLPGVKKSDVNIEVEERQVRISGARKKETEKHEGATHFLERVQGTFERRFTLPKDVDSERVTARYEDGVLSLSLPKSEASKPRQVSIL